MAKRRDECVASQFTPRACTERGLHEPHPACRRASAWMTSCWLCSRGRAPVHYPQDPARRSRCSQERVWSSHTAISLHRACPGEYLEQPSRLTDCCSLQRGRFSSLLTISVIVSSVIRTASAASGRAKMRFLWCRRALAAASIARLFIVRIGTPLRPLGRLFCKIKTSI